MGGCGGGDFSINIARSWPPMPEAAPIVTRYRATDARPEESALIEGGNSLFRNDRAILLNSINPHKMRFP